jgi:hypothetical protein
MPFVRFIVYGIAKTLSKVFGLATMSFFGRLPSRDDDKMALVGLLAISWLPVVVAIPFPAFGEMIIPFAPEDEGMIRVIAAVTAVLLPLTVGLVVSQMHNQSHRSRGARLSQVAKGFWYTPVIGLTVAAVVVVVPLVKVTHITRRLDVQRLLVMIPEGSYEQVLDHARERLRERGIEVERRPPNTVIQTLFRVLGFVLQHVFDRDVADDMQLLRGHDVDGGWFEITVHAADISIIGKQRQTCRLHAVLAEELDERIVYFTWDDDSQELEDRMRGLRERLEAGEQVEIDGAEQLAEDLAGLELDKEEWNNVRRNLYRLERDICRSWLGRGSYQPRDAQASAREVAEEGSRGGAPTR